jgi:hypothetical protein
MLIEKLETAVAPSLWVYFGAGVATALVFGCLLALCL